nr:hypothetical protein [Mesorhizobium sp. ESP7-2]
MAGKLRISVEVLLSEPVPELVTSRASTRDETIFPGVGNQRLAALTSRHFRKVTIDSMPATVQAKPTNRNLSSNSPPDDQECSSPHIDSTAPEMSRLFARSEMNAGNAIRTTT